MWNLPDQLPTWINTSAPVVLTALYYEDTVLQLADSIRNDPPNQLVVFDLRKENKADSDKVSAVAFSLVICDSTRRGFLLELSEYFCSIVVVGW